MGAAARACGLIAGATCLLVCLARPARADSALAATEAAGTMFPKGLWTLQFHGLYTHSISKDDSVSSAVASVGYYFGNRHVLRLELAGNHMDNEEGGPDSDDAVAPGFNLGLRWHFLEYGGFTLFVEGLAGLSYGEHNFPRGGTHFNFNEQAGLGATFRLDEHLHFVGGARYIHISNARIRGRDENPGYDGLGGYLGVMFTY